MTPENLPVLNLQVMKKSTGVECGQESGEFSSKKCRILCIFIAKKTYRYLWPETGTRGLQPNWDWGGRTEDVNTQRAEYLAGGSNPPTFHQLAP